MYQFKNLDKYSYHYLLRPSGGVIVVFGYTDTAFTLSPEDIGKHEDGWNIEGEILTDYYGWVNKFKAYKRINNNKDVVFVEGDFEDYILCSSLEALDDFLENHKPEDWDYADI